MIVVLMPHCSSVECKCIFLFSERCNLWHPDRWAETERLHSCHGDQRHILSHQHHFKDHCSCQAMTRFRPSRTHLTLLMEWQTRLFIDEMCPHINQSSKGVKGSRKETKYLSCSWLTMESMQDWCIKINFDIFW